jgi:LMBR1 domain-containing protein 1
MAANPVLIVTAVIFAILIFVASVYFLVYFQHPDDKLVAWFPKIVVVCRVLSAFREYLRVFRFLDYL